MKATKNTILLKTETEGPDENGSKLSPPHWSLPGAGGFAGAGCKEQLSDTECGQAGPMDNLWGPPLRTVSQWVRRPDVKYLRCKHCLPVMRRGHSVVRQAMTGFSLHDGVAAGTNKREKLDRLRRYIALHGSKELKRSGTRVYSCQAAKEKRLLILLVTADVVSSPTRPVGMITTRSRSTQIEV